MALQGFADCQGRWIARDGVEIGKVKLTEVKAIAQSNRDGEGIVASNKQAGQRPVLLASSADSADPDRTSRR